MVNAVSSDVCTAEISLKCAIFVTPWENRRFDVAAILLMFEIMAYIRTVSV
jgi:hypothetical protein